MESCGIPAPDWGLSHVPRTDTLDFCYAHQRPLRASLLALALIVLTPGLLFAAWYANSWATSEQSQIEQMAGQAADGIMAAVDRQITATRTMLLALATSPSLQTDDIRAFYDQASRISKDLGTHVVLRDMELDQQVIHTAFRLGEYGALPGLPMPVEVAKQRVLSSGKPQVSNLFHGRRLNEATFVIMVPIIRAGAVRYILSASLRAQSIANIMAQFNLDPDWIATVVDQDQVVVARSRPPRGLVGRRPPDTSWTHLLDKGQVAGKTIDGKAARHFFSRSETTGWNTGIAVPERKLAAASKWALGTLAAASIFFLLAAGTLAHQTAGRLSSRFGALQTADIIERKLNEEQFNALAESVSTGFIALDEAGNIMFVNSHIESIFQYPREEIVGRSIDMLVPERYRKRHAEVRRAFAVAPKPRVMGAGRALTGLRKDGSEFPIKVGLSSIETNFGRLILATMADLTAQNQAKEHLSAILIERDELLRRLVQAQEQERLRLARDLHDQTGQVVAAAMMELRGMEPFVDSGGRKRIHQLRGRLDKMSKALHRIAWELRPASIDEIGLIDTLKDYVTEWSSEFNIPAEFFCSSRRINKLSDEVNTTVYRVVQEALTNVAKHARDASAVSVIVDFSGSELRLTIEDNGCGFDARAMQANSSPRRGLGLDGIRERLSLLGGDVQIEAAAGAGTTLFIRIPLEQERMIA